MILVPTRSDHAGPHRIAAAAAPRPPFPVVRSPHAPVIRDGGGTAPRPAQARQSAGHTTGLGALQAALDEPVEHRGHVLRVSASVGHCHRNHLPVPILTDALSAADTSMYAAKGHGRRNTR